jgi:eukaryotic-like serine/threonine-protein kinase
VFDMSLPPGTRLGPYEILGPLGAGGMGEVYRATDTRLHREVAIKVSPEHFSERFEREARAIAALNHPNICHLYDVGTNYLVMELVAGESPQGPLPIETALNYARQIADALEAAHEKGIIHRDLKPDNLKINPDGVVKVLDFGLAKTFTEASETEQGTIAPTQSKSITGAGTVLGTSGYMSPEQAQGKISDRRADIWAFGVVLHEMLTGQRLFHGETISGTLVAVMTKEPEWDRIPAKVQRLLRSCLEKDPKRRLRDIADAWKLLDEEPGAAVPRARRSWFAGVSLALAAAVGVALWAPWRRPMPSSDPIRFQIPLNVTGEDGSLKVSPDGRYLAFAAVASDGVTRIWVRAMDSVDARPLPAAETDPVVGAIIWSPDSRFIAFDSGGKLKKIDLSGGLAQTLCELPGPAIGGAWSREGVIVLGSLTGGLARVSALGGALIPLTKLDTSRNEAYHVLPFFLPDGRHFLYLRVSKTAPEKTGLYVGSLDVQPGDQGVKQVLATTTGAAYAASRGARFGYLLFQQDGKLMAQQFDAERLELLGVPVPLADRIGSYIDVAEFSASPSVLVYRAGDENLQLTWFDRDGKDLGRVGPAARYASLALSPDQKRVIVSRVNPQTSVKNELLLMDLSPERTTRFTSNAYSNFPVWSTDGSRVAFHTSTPGAPTDLYQKLASGAKEQELLVHSNEDKQPTSWSQDGRSLLYVSHNPVTKADLWTVSTERDSKPLPFLRTESSEHDGQFSPSGHWVAYTSDESGRDEVYLRTFPDGADKVPVSTAGGGSPRWRGDGKELFYLASDGKLMAVDILPGHESQPGTPKALFQASRVFDASCSCMPDWSVTADGKRFLFAVPTEQSPQAPFTVVLNWMAGLRH